MAENAEASGASGKRLHSLCVRDCTTASCIRSRCCHWARKEILLILTVTGVLLGVLLGFLLRLAKPSADTIKLISFPGDMLLRMLKLLILPLVMSSLVTGLASLGSQSGWRMMVRTITYFLATTLLAIVLGILLVQAIQPGDPGIKPRPKVSRDRGPSPTTLEAVLDLVRNMVPENLVQTGFQHQRTVIEKSATSKKWVRQLKSSDGINVLGIITFSCILGILLGRLGPSARPMIDLFILVQEITMKMVYIAMWYSPVGIMFLITGKLLSLEDPSELGKKLGMYMVTVLVGLILHGAVTLPLIYFLITRKNPLKLFLGVFQAWITALGTSSSAATLPVTLRCMEEIMKVDPRVTRFVIPIGATINMDGTALYEAVAPIFIAQVNEIQLGIAQLITISMTATFASIGAAALPSAGLVTMVIVLTSVDLPAEDVSLILAVDWFLDRVRTSVNVLGDCFGAGIVAHLSQKELSQHSGMDGSRPSSAPSVDQVI